MVLGIRLSWLGVNPNGWPNSRVKLELESKQAMRAHGLGSPDRADAVLGAMMPAQTGGCAYTRVPMEHDEDRIASTWPRGRILV